MTKFPISANPRLDGRVALVTGGTGGIGRAVCATLADAGARVVATDLQEDRSWIEATAGVTFLRHDVTSRAETEAVIDRVAGGAWPARHPRPLRRRHRAHAAWRQARTPSGGPCSM